MKKNLLTLIGAFCLFTSAAFAQMLPNGDFENWTNDSTAVSWTGTITMTMPPITFYTLYKEPIGHSGFAGKMITQPAPIVSIPTTGFCNYGVAGFNISTMSPFFTGGVPISMKPTKVKGYFKYENNVGDTMSIGACCFLAGDTLGLGEFTTTTATPAWTLFEVPITYSLPGTPDTINVVMFSSAGLAPQLGTTLYVDDVSMETGSDIGEISMDVLNAYPNPVNDIMNIDLDGTFNLIKLYNNSGQLVFTDATTAQKYSLNLNTYSNGIYFVEVSNGGKRMLKKIVVK
jgi:hypothetical protein